MTFTEKKQVPIRSWYPTVTQFRVPSRVAKLGIGRTRAARLNKLIPAYLFFREHGGGIVGENAKGALNLYESEMNADGFFRDLDKAIHKCENCGECWLEEELNEVEDLALRVAPGEPMPSGECPDCGAVCHAIARAEGRDK